LQWGSLFACIFSHFSRRLPLEFWRNCALFRAGRTTEISAQMDTPTARILIIEDNPDDEELLLHQLRKAHLDQHVKVISDGRSAIEYLRETGSRNEEIIALFLDLHLPIVSGLQVLEQVRLNEQTSDLPVIVVTSSNSPEDLEKCHRLGVSCYVQKPITLTTFSKAIADSFNASRSMIDPTSLRMTSVE
jgi:CheY-like chemotaxis protein